MHTTAATTSAASAQPLQALALQAKCGTYCSAQTVALHPREHTHAHAGMQQRRAVIAHAAAAIISSTALVFNAQQASAAVPTIDEYNGGVGSQPKTNNYLNSARTPKQSAVAPANQVGVTQTITVHYQQ
jgi:hypothetical protein